MSKDFTIAEFLEFARSKPADEEYCYTSNGNCAIAQFLITTGRSSDPNVGANGEWDDNSGVEHPCPSEIKEAAARVDLDLPNLGRTFGALVTRLEALVQETPAKPSRWLSPQTNLDADLQERV